MASDETIALKTGADALIDLLQQRGELALKDAAQALGQPESVVESWASFLEEDGLVKIRYKFTTPYYSIAGTDEKAGKKAKKSEPPSASPPPPAPVSALRKSPAELLGEAEAALQKGDMEQARELYLQVKQVYEKLPVDLEERAHNLLQGLTSVGSHYFQAGQNRIRQLAKQSADALKKGGLQEARQAYEHAKRQFEILPGHPTKERVQLESELLTLAESLASKEYSALLAQATGFAKTVEDLLKQAIDALQKGNVPVARQFYQELIAAKDAIPVGFLPKKAELDAKTLHLNEQLTEATLRAASRDFDMKAAQLQQLFTQAEGLVKKGMLDQALTPFEQARKLFASLPEGFLERRSKLHTELLKLSKALIGARFSKAQSDFNAKKKVIDGFIADAEKYLKANDISRAQLAYEKLIPLVNDLPQDFAEEALNYRLRLIELYRKLTT